jgi:hypothetical protein
VTLTDGAYLLLGTEVSTIIDQQTGQPLLYLAPDPAQLWRAAREIERQEQGLRTSAAAKQAWIEWVSWLEFAHWRADDQRELANLRATADQVGRARTRLGSVPENPPPTAPPPVADAVEVMSNIWMLPDGSGLVLKTPDGLAFMDGRAWYRDQARGQVLADPYPSGFKTMIVNYLAARVRDRAATNTRLDDSIRLEEIELGQLLVDKSEYETIGRTDGESTMVEYGTSEIPLREALQRTNTDITKTQQRITLLQQQRSRLPTDLALTERVVASLSR